MYLFIYLNMTVWKLAVACSVEKISCRVVLLRSAQKQLIVVFSARISSRAAITKSLGSQIVSLPCLLYSWRENAVSMIYGHCEMTGNTTNVVSWHLTFWMRGPSLVSSSWFFYSRTGVIQARKPLATPPTHIWERYPKKKKVFFLAASVTGQEEQHTSSAQCHIPTL